jgi:hypothetical protein
MCIKIGAFQNMKLLQICNFDIFLCGMYLSKQKENYISVSLHSVTSVLFIGL